MVNLIKAQLYRQLFGREQLLALNQESESVEYSTRYPIPDYVSADWLLEAAKPHYEPYIELMRRFYKVKTSDLTFDNPPHQDGWWIKKGDTWVRVKRPQGEVGYIDFETNTQIPFCAVLISLLSGVETPSVYYYVATEPNNQQVSVGDFKLLIGHNIVAFDRQYIVEAYQFNSQLRFIDTKALHKFPYGLGEASQEATWRKEMKKDYLMAWASNSSPSDLASACKLLLGVELDKSLQKAHLEKWSDIQKRMSEYLEYCFKDCLYGIQLYQKIMQVWRDYCPHPFSLYGLLERSTLRLTLDKSYKQQIDKVNKLVNERKAQFGAKLKAAYLRLNNYEPLDEHLERAGKQYQPTFTLRSNIAALVLQVHWKGKPLYRRPIGDSKRLFAWGIETEDGWEVLPGGQKERTGNPLGKTHYSQYVIKELEIKHPDFTYSEIYEFLALTSMWDSYHKRLTNVVTRDNVWLPDSCPAGTVTGRVTGGISAVIPNPDSKKAGSEFKLLLQPSPGNKLVKSDMDRQEVVIASALVDGDNKFCGSTQFCQEALLGDYHQVVADRLGMSDQRRLIKNLNFACMFGAGANLISSMILQTGGGRYNQEQARNLALEHQKALKGIKDWGQWKYGVASELFNNLNERAKKLDQRTAIFKRKVPNSLNVRYQTIHHNTAANYAVQSVGQELIDIVLIGVRVFSKILDYTYNPMILIHDEIAFDVPPENASKVEHAMQLSHLLSKVMMYKELGVRDFPESQMWFKEVNIDFCLRKECSRVITPTFDSDEHFGEMV